VVLVPAAEPVVGALRRELDPAAGRGVPAHVTVLYPWLAPKRIGEAALAALAMAVSAVPPFDVAFERVAWFGDEVVHLVPEPEAPFRALTEAVTAAFPETPPYGGAYDEVVPHLTLGHGAPVDILRRAAAAVAPRLPFRASVAAVHVLQGVAGPDRWRVTHELPLTRRLS
jgi:2'-5' RNA ligase